MAKQYKDFARKVVESKPRISINLPTPNTKIQNQLFDSVQDFIGTIRKGYLVKAEAKAKMSGTERGSNPDMTYVDGTPQLQPHEAGGIVYQQAYQLASKQAYQNELSIAVDNKTNEALKEWGAKGNKNDVEGLANTFKLKFDPMLENVTPEFSTIARQMVQKSTATYIQQYTKEKITNDTNNKYNALLKGFAFLTNEISANKILPNTPEAEEYLNKHKENFEARAVFDLSLTAEIYDREVQDLNKTMFINDFFSKVEQVGNDGRPVTNNQHLDQIYSALNSAEDRKIMLGGEEVSSKIFNDAGLTIEDRNSIKTQLRNIKQIRVSSFTNQFEEIKVELDTKINDIAKDINTALLRGDVTNANRFLEKATDTRFLDNYIVPVNKKATVLRYYNDRVQVLENSILKVENKQIQKEQELVYGAKFNYLLNDLVNGDVNTVLSNVLELEEINYNPAIKLIKDDLQNNPDNLPKAQNLFKLIDQNIDAGNNKIDVADAMINILNGVGNTTEGLNLFGKTNDEILTDAGVYKDLIIDRLEAKKRESPSGGSTSVGAEILSKIDGGGYEITNTEVGQAVDHLLKDATADVIKQDKLAATRIVQIYSKSKTAMLSDHRPHKLINKYLNNFDIDGLVNFAIPIYKGMQQNDGFYSGSDRTKGLLSALSVYSLDDLKELGKSIKEIAVNTPDNVFDSVSTMVLEQMNIKPSSATKDNPNVGNASKDFIKDDNVQKIIMNEAEKAGKSFEYNQTRESFGRNMFFTSMIDLLANKKLEADSIEETIKTRAKHFFRNFSPFTFDMGVGKINEDRLMNNNNFITRNSKDAHNKYGNFLNNMGIKSKDIPSNTFRNSFHLVNQIKEKIKNNNIDTTQITDGNTVKDIPDWIYSFPSLNAIESNVALKDKLINKFFGKDKEFVIEAINGDTVLNMQKSVDLQDHFTFNGVPLIPGKTLKFKLDLDTNKFEVYTKFGQFVQPLIDTSTGQTLLVDAPPNQTRNLDEQSKVENVMQAIDRARDINTDFGEVFSMGMAQSPLAHIYNGEFEEKPDQSNAIPSLSNKANFNNAEAFVVNTKRNLLLQNAITPDSYNNSAKGNYIIEDNNKFLLVPSQIVYYQDGQPRVLNHTLEDAKKYAYFNKNNIPQYDSKQEAENRNKVIEKVVEEDAIDLLGDANAVPVPELQNITSKGQSVVNKTIDVINKALPFGKWEKAMLQGIAITESNNGEHENTFKPNRGSIGIWQLDKGTADKSMFQDLKRRFKEYQAGNTEHNLFGQNVDKITEGLKKQGYDFNLATMTYRQLQQPINSGAVVRLFLTLYKTSDYNSLAKAGPFWKNNFNTLAGKGKTEDFLTKAATYYNNL